MSYLTPGACKPFPKHKEKIKIFRFFLFSGICFPSRHQNLGLDQDFLNNLDPDKIFLFGSLHWYSQSCYCCIIHHFLLYIISKDNILKVPQISICLNRIKAFLLQKFIIISYKKLCVYPNTREKPSKNFFLRKFGTMFLVTGIFLSNFIRKLF